MGDETPKWIITKRVGRVTFYWTGQANHFSTAVENALEFNDRENALFVSETLKGSTVVEVAEPPAIQGGDQGEGVV